jgi:hypothetical protein
MAVEPSQTLSNHSAGITCDTNTVTNGDDVSAKTTYSHIIAKIDAFLLASDSSGSDLRRRTQEKVKETITIIQRALDEYGCIPGISQN